MEADRIFADGTNGWREELAVDASRHELGRAVAEDGAAARARAEVYSY